MRLDEATERILYEPISAKEKAFESDAAVWGRMREIYFNEKGQWKKWLPFYGPTAVREVKVGTGHIHQIIHF